MLKMKPCCLCGSNTLKIWRSLQSKKVQVECEICHYAGKRKITIRGAIRAWNREKRPSKIMVDFRNGHAQAD